MNMNVSVYQGKGSQPSTTRVANWCPALRDAVTST